jgi:hypothetical protein
MGTNPLFSSGLRAQCLGRGATAACRLHLLRAIRTGGGRRLERDTRFQETGGLRTDPLHPAKVMKRPERSVPGPGFDDPLCEAGADPRQAREVLQGCLVDPDPPFLLQAGGRGSRRVDRNGRPPGGENDQEGVSPPRRRERFTYGQSDQKPEG